MSSQIISGHLEASQTISCHSVYLLPDHNVDHVIASQTISGYLGASQTISCWPFRSLPDHFGFPDHFWPFRSLPNHFLFIYSQTITWIMSANLGASQTISGYLKPPRPFLDLKTSQTISTPCLGLKQPFVIWSNNNNIKRKKP